jgi:hypothetical protein
MNKQLFYVWYDNHYVYDFKKISETRVLHLLSKTKKRLRSYFKIECDDIILHDYSKSKLKRKLIKRLRKINSNIKLKKI